jgi:tetratricopeptide (TPR) repeat protein
VTSGIRAAALGLIAMAALGPAPARADPFPRTEQVALPQERLAVQHLSALFSGSPDAPIHPLAALDGILTETHGLSPLRGVVQALRAYALMNDNRGSDAVAAIEESIRLLPTYSGPLILGVAIESYNGHPDMGGDHFLRAIALDPEAARRLNDHELLNLIERLRQQHDDRRVALIAERLFAIRWSGDDLKLRSSLARDLIKARVAQGDIAGARAALPYLAFPPHARELLISLAYSSLWPDIESWTGPFQQGQWLSYLAETRARWQASHDPAQAQAYVDALAAAGHDRTMVREMLPVLMGPLDREHDYQLIWVVARVASALADLGRWDEADSLFAHVLTIWPFGSDANAINFTANRAKLLLVRGRSQDALDLIDRSIADAEQRGGAISRSPLADLHFVRACALHRLGRDAEAASSTAVATSDEIQTAASTYLCLERPDAARTLLIDAAAQESLRADVADYMQPDDGPRDHEPLTELVAAGHEALRHDPDLLRAIGTYARILPYSARVGAPTEEIAP